MLKSTAKHILEGRIVLASKSPRRIELLNNLNINAEIIPSDFDENLNRSNYTSHGEFVMDIATHKALEVFSSIKESNITLIIAADTIVVNEDIIYNKPKDKEEAIKMLSNLSGKIHTVYTGVCLKTQKEEIKFWESTDVKFGDLTLEQIKAYVETGESLDKAGGYGVQGTGGSLIEKVNGDFYTVVGLPLYSLVKHLNNLFSKA